MRSFIVRLLNLVVLLLTMYLFARSPSIPLFIPVIVLVAALIEQERRLSFGHLREVDRELFQKFMSELPAESDAVQFLKNHSMGATFFREQLKPLRDFDHYWASPDRQFVSRRLEKRRLAFLQMLGAFLGELTHHIEPHANRDDCYRFFGKEDYSQFEITKQKLNALASSAYDAYVKVVNTGRQMM